jgi:zinc protease
MILAVAGPVDHRKITRLCKRAFADLHHGKEQPLRTPRTSQAEPQFVHVAEDSSQTQLQMLFRALPELDPDYPSLLMLMRVLDDGMSTRLHSRLCDELGLAYHVSAGLEPFVDTGLIEIDGAAKPNSAPALVRESLALCAALASDGPRAEELAKAKRRYQWDLQRSFDDADAMAGWWGGSRLFYPPLGFAAKLARVAAVTKESVQRAAARVFRPERLTVVAVGPSGRKAQLASAARGFGAS